jgi:hypothetical protein
MNKLSPKDFSYLCSTQAVRERSKRIYEKALAGETHFKVNESRIAECAQFVQDLILKNYPELDVPFHSRWEHLNVGGISRIASMRSNFTQLDKKDWAVLLTDLVIVSVLLDAGAGPDWSYRGKEEVLYTRSEGLAVASFDMFEAGYFSSNPKNPYQVDSEGLKNLTLEKMALGFQISDKNPMTGLEGRVEMMRSLGSCLEKHADFFLYQKTLRPGHLIQWYLSESDDGKTLSAQLLLRGLLESFGDMWPDRCVINGIRMGDVWTYPSTAQAGFESWVPFHKLSQWLAYSLIYPLDVVGLSVPDVHELTGLPEYRNGGLLLDKGVLELRDPAQADVDHSVDSDFVVEWRALTVTLLDQLATHIRSSLNLSEAELPLGKVLQGGTWLAGRETAATLRGGMPPFKIKSDGTVF